MKIFISEVEAWQDRAKAAETRFKTLEKAFHALEKSFHAYGDHTANCAFRKWGHVKERNCDCGFLKIKAAIKQGGKVLAKLKEDG